MKWKQHFWQIQLFKRTLHQQIIYQLYPYSYQQQNCAPFRCISSLFEPERQGSEAGLLWRPSLVVVFCEEICVINIIEDASHA